MSGLRDLHYEEDGRCGECFEEWPCAVSKGAFVSSIRKWQYEEERKHRDIRRASNKSATDEVNALLARLDYPLYRWQESCQAQLVTTEMMLNLLQRLEKAETNARES